MASCTGHLDRYLWADQNQQIGLKVRWYPSGAIYGNRFINEPTDIPWVLRLIMGVSWGVILQGAGAAFGLTGAALSSFAAGGSTFLSSVMTGVDPLDALKGALAARSPMSAPWS